METKLELENIAWNRRSREFMEDYSCLGCKYFGDHCISFTGDEGFKCPLEDTSSAFYADFVIDNYGELCEIVESPTREQWKKIGGDRSKFSKLYLAKSMKVKIWMPRTSILEKMIAQFKIDEKVDRCLCEFSIAQFHKRMRELLKYQTSDRSISHKIARQLIDIIVPIDVQGMFEFGERNGKQD